MIIEIHGVRYRHQKAAPSQLRPNERPCVLCDLRAGREFSCRLEDYIEMARKGFGVRVTCYMSLCRPNRKYWKRLPS